MKTPPHKFNIGDVVQFRDEPDLGPHIITGINFTKYTHMTRVVVYYQLDQHFHGTDKDVEETDLEPCQVTEQNEWYVKPILDAFEFAETHCWDCEAEIGRDWKDGDKCPDCGRDLVPF